ncbi:MAG: hypothetical protein HQL67_12325 [Magnetococcales bacterium]|nr:hypothetical protein [Magnetococcales bacterium]
MNGLDPSLMTAEERLDEVAEILSSAILRRRQRRVKKSDKKANVSLDMSAKERLHVSDETDITGDRP